MATDTVANHCLPHLRLTRRRPLLPGLLVGSAQLVGQTQAERHTADATDERPAVLPAQAAPARKEAERLEERLRPINALIGLLAPNDISPSVLASAGCVLAALEVPVTGNQGKVVIDGVVLHRDSTRLLLCEAKSGANVDVAQARRYAAIDPGAVVQAGHVTLPHRIAPTSEVLYVCVGAHVERIRRGLAVAELDCPVLAVYDDRITLENPDAASDWLQAAFGSEPLRLSAPPARFIAFDHESPVEAILPAVRTELVAALSRRTPQVTLPALTERATPYFGLYGRGARGALVRHVAEAARRIAAEDPATFMVEPATANRDGLVRLLRTPEDNDPRGRTQAYQALARRSHTRPRRAARSNPDQFDLLQELEQDDDLADEDDGPNDEGPNEEEAQTP